MNVDAETLKIEITRGDTSAIDVVLTQDIPEDGTIALISMKETLKTKTPEWEKRIEIVDGAFSFNLTHADTNFPPGRYWWDVRLLYENGTIYTPIKPSPFVICEVVGNA